MSQIPEGANTVHGEGPDLKKAILAAAGELGIEADHLPDPQLVRDAARMAATLYQENPDRFGALTRRAN